MQEDSSAKEVWGRVCGLLREISRDTYEQWFQPIVPLTLEGNEIVLGVSDEFFAEWITNNYLDMLSEALDSAAGRSLDVTFETGFTPEVVEEAFEESNPVCKSEEEETEAEQVTAPNCLARHTFNNFVVGEENRYAYTAALTVAQSPGIYNPLYIYGSTGMGKTHLLQAVAHEVLKDNPRAIIRYITCEEFLNRYVDSLRMKKHAEFRNMIRTADFLLVDDVHHLANKTQLQEEFFNTFNTLYNANKQIILTSDKQPCEIVGLESRLVSRFECGVATEITTPGLETRLAILKMKQDEHMVKLDDEILFFIAARITSSIRRLEGALLRLVAYSSAMSNCKITVEKAEELLSKLLEEEATTHKVSIDNIQKRVAEFYGLHVHDLIGNKRPKNIAEPRMLAMYLSRRLTDHSYPEIGLAFGGRTHATVMHAEKKIAAESKLNESMRRTVTQLQRQLQA